MTQAEAESALAAGLEVETLKQPHSRMLPIGTVSKIAKLGRFGVYLEADPKHYYLIHELQLFIVPDWSDTLELQ